MLRRDFLAGIGTSAIGRVSAATARITRIRYSTIQGRFHKFVAMNSYDKAPKGHTYEHGMLRIETSAGTEGIGPGGGRTPAYFEALRGLIGADPLAIYEMRDGRITGRSPAFFALLERYPHLDGALFDLAGKLTGKPAWSLIGDAARERVDAYDGTLYFSDIWFRDRGGRAVAEEVEEAVRSGYRAVKLKAGRGSKWMPREAGLARDIEVIRAARRAAGPEVKILVDPNDGYRNDMEGAWRLLEATAQERLHWIEEIFPENVEHYTELRSRMERAQMRTLIAEGESMSRPGQFAPYLKPRRLLDVLQSDIRACGFLGNLEVARMGEAAGALTIPHNWASRMGFLMGLHFAKAVKSAPAAEDDRSTYDVVEAEGYRFENGAYTVPDSPGLSLRVNEDAYREKCLVGEVVVG